MIGRLTGNIIEASPDEFLLDVGGVGYLLSIPRSTYVRLSCGAGQAISLHVHTHVREDAIQLFGFATTEERGAFESLLTVSGIGPKLALAVLSGVEVEDLARAIAHGERAVLEKIPGIGRRTAERLLVELKDRWPKTGTLGPRRGLRVAAAAGTPAAVDSDAVSALMHLGYAESVAAEAVIRARRSAEGEVPLEDMLRAALRALSR